MSSPTHRIAALGLLALPLLWGCAGEETDQRANFPVGVGSDDHRVSQGGIPEDMMPTEATAMQGMPEEALPTKSMEYFLSAQHWLDAFPPPLTLHCEQLCRQVSALLGVEPVAAAEPY